MSCPTLAQTRPLLRNSYTTKALLPQRNTTAAAATRLVKFCAVCIWEANQFSTVIAHTMMMIISRGRRMWVEHVLGKHFAKRFIIFLLVMMERRPRRNMIIWRNNEHYSNGLRHSRWMMGVCLSHLPIACPLHHKQAQSQSQWFATICGCNDDDSTATQRNIPGIK